MRRLADLAGRAMAVYAWGLMIVVPAALFLALCVAPFVLLWWFLS